jgi:hypothetical protein
VTWWDLFSAQHCPNCFLKIKQPGHGLRRSTCEKCHATLPDAIALHLDRAMHSRWYVAWWRIAMQMLRQNEALENRPADRTERKPASAAHYHSSTIETAPAKQKEGSAC